MHKIFQEAIESNQNNMTYYADQIALLAMVAGQFEDIPELSDISSLSISKYGGTTNMSFYLKEDRKGSKLVHKLAQKFGVKFDKNPAYDKQTLLATGTSNDGLWYFEVSGYVPSTCALVTEEIELTEEEIEQARSNVPTKKVVTKVVCA